MRVLVPTYTLFWIIQMWIYKLVYYTRSHPNRSLSSQAAGWNKVDGNIFGYRDGRLGGGVLPTCGRRCLSSSHKLNWRGNVGGHLAAGMMLPMVCPPLLLSSFSLFPSRWSQGRHQRKEGWQAPPAAPLHSNRSTLTKWGYHINNNSFGVWGQNSHTFFFFLILVLVQQGRSSE